MPAAKIQSLSWQLRAKAELERRKRTAGEQTDVNTVGDLARYQSDPVGFGKEVLKESYTEDVCRMMESVRDNVITVAKSGNGVGKSHGAARIALWFYKCFPGSQVYTAAAPPEDNLRRILWGEIGSVMRQNTSLFASDRIMSMWCSHGPRNFLVGVTIPLSGTPEMREGKFAGKHAPYLLFIVDEGDAVPMEVYKGIESCMSGGFARLLVLFNPRAQSGPVWKMEREKRANIVELSAVNHPNVISGEDQIPGAVTQETVVRRINQWSRPLVPGELRDVECFDVPPFLVGKTAVTQDDQILPPLMAGVRKVTEPSLFYMVLGQYPPQSETQLISRAWIENARSRYIAYITVHGEVPPWGVRPIHALDVAEFGKDNNVSMLRYGGWVKPPEIWGGVDPDATAIRGAAIYREYFALASYVDATGVGAGVAPRMTRLGCENAYGVKVATSPTYKTEQGEFAILRDQLWWSVREWLRTDAGAMLPPDDLLCEELSTPTYSTLGGKIRVMDKESMRALLGRSPDRADALALTFAPDEFAAGEYGANPIANYRG